MDQNLKYSVGIDMSKESFDACISVINTLQVVIIKATRKFNNTRHGFDEFLIWIKKHLKEDLPVVVTLEATGVYYEELAIFLFKNDLQVSVVLPNKAKKYLQSKGHKSKNDKIDAKGLSQMGAEQNLARWEPFSKNTYELRSLTRQNEDLQAQKTMINNRLEAYKFSGYKNKLIEKQLLSMIKFLNKQLKEVNTQIEKSVDGDELLKNKFNKICKIKGLGILTVASIVGETNGFKLIKNQRQLVSYAGYDIIENQSGNRIGKTRISKKGNSHIRRALHMPALNVVTYEQAGFKALYERVYASTGFKMKGYVAVQRKLLMLIYTLWKRDEEYDPNRLIIMDNASGDDESKFLFSLNSEGVAKKIGGIKPPTLDKLRSDESSEVLFSLLQN
jgi:transposase